MGALNPYHCLRLTKQGSLHHDNGISIFERENIIDKPKGWSSINIGRDPIKHKQKQSIKTQLLVTYY